LVRGKRGKGVQPIVEDVHLVLLEDITSESPQVKLAAKASASLKYPPQLPAPKSVDNQWLRMKYGPEA